jgi:HK97 family phage portal protein
MGILRDFFERRFEQGPDYTISEDPTGRLLSFGPPSAAGVPVSEARAEGLAAVYGCTGVLADIEGWVPLKLQRELEGGGSEDAVDHPLYYLLHDQPNHLMTAFDLKNVLSRWKNLWGTAYAEIEYNRRGEPAALWPLRTDRMAPPTTNHENRLTWTYRLQNGGTKTYVWDPFRPPLFRLMINSLDGITGRSPVRVVMDALGSALATRDFGAALFKNQAAPRGVLKFKSTPKDPATRERNEENWNKVMAGPANAGRTAVLHGDVDYTPIGIPPAEAQFVELLAAQRLDIRGYIYRVPGFLVGDTEKSTTWGTGIEQQFRGFLNVTMMPHFTAWSQAVKRDLLSAKGAARHKAVWITDAFVQADLLQRVQAQKLQIEAGILTPNQARAQNELGPRQLPDGGRDPEGDAYVRPLNMTTTAEPAPQPESKPQPKKDDDDEN